MPNQITNTVLMVRPAHFGFNPETATNNAFQTRNMALSAKEVAEKARTEFDTLVKKMRSVGIEVIVIEDTEEPVKKDAIFPNNWFSTHSNGDLVTYPMFAPIRRLERRADILTMLEQKFHYNNHIRLEENELDGKFLEATGSIIFDRPNRLAYACRSIRTHEGLLDEFCTKKSYKKIIFDASDEQGISIYHTNVMMALGETFCVICLEAIKDKEEKKAIISFLQNTDKEIIAISFAQMNAFAGNMLQIKGADQQSYLAMSSQAYHSLTEEQIKRLEAHTKLLHSPINTIETSGGGSVRCMIAEIFKPDH